MPHSQSPPSADEVARIAALEEPVLRNLRITWCYHELSVALAARLGPSANWCTFAAWASKQAGQTIRREDLTRTFENLFGATPEAAETLGEIARTLARRTWNRDAAGTERILQEELHPSAAFDRAGASVARGNLVVFEEIAPFFARFLELLGGIGIPDRVAMETFWGELEPGPPPAGQDLLRSAFRGYHKALSEPDAKSRAETILAANLEIGAHEQSRLQPEIAAALEAPAPDARTLRRRFLARLHPRLGPLRPALDLYLVVTTPIDRLWGRATELARTKARLAVTELMMTLALPGEVLRLGDDLGADFPTSLRKISSPELAALLARFDPTPDSVAASGAVDWADFDERMHFIADYFRSYQERESLHQALFTVDQVRDIREGRIPQGRL